MINQKLNKLPDEQINYFMQNLNNDNRDFIEHIPETSLYLDFNHCSDAMYDSTSCFEVSMAISESYIN